MGFFSFSFGAAPVCIYSSSTVCVRCHLSLDLRQKAHVNVVPGSCQIYSYFYGVPRVANGDGSVIGEERER